MAFAFTAAPNEIADLPGTPQRGLCRSGPSPRQSAITRPWRVASDLCHAHGGRTDSGWSEGPEAGWLVEVAGVEPASPELLVGLLRAQPLGSVTYRRVNGTLSIGHPRFNVPVGPEALPTGEPSWMTPRRDE